MPARDSSSAPGATDDYDVIVVGSGLGGLSAAALLARAGRKVLVVERASGPGGCAHAFQRGPYLFDPAVHVTLDGAEGHFLTTLLRELDVHDRCTLVETGDLYTVVFPEFRLRVPVGREAFATAYVDAFPDSESQLLAFLDHRTRVVEQLRRMPPQLGLADLPRAMARFPLVFSHRKDTLAKVLDAFVDDPHARAALTAVWPYEGLPPSRLSFFFFAQLLELLMDGAYYPLGSFQALADAFVTAIERDGGELQFDIPVTRILVDKGRARGVELGSGSTVRAPVVIANTDPHQTFEQLVGLGNVPRGYWNTLRRMKPSLSGFVVYAARRGDVGELGLAHENFVYRHWNHDETLQDILAARPGGMWLNVPTLADPSLAPAGEHLLIMSSLAPYDIGRPWDEERDRFAEALVGCFEQAFPGLASDLRIIEVATPESIHAATRAYQGALYGYENTPAQSGNKRPTHQTPVDGLYLAGQWSFEAGSSFRVMLSGVETARLLLEPTGESGPAARVIGAIGGTPPPAKFDPGADRAQEAPPTPLP